MVCHASEWFRARYPNVEFYGNLKPQVYCDYWLRYTQAQREAHTEDQKRKTKAMASVPVTTYNLAFRDGVPYFQKANPKKKFRRNGWTINEPLYPFARKTEQYEKYTPSELLFAAKDAREAYKNAEATLRHNEKEYGFSSPRDQQVSGWYADDMATIGTVARRKGIVLRMNGAKKRKAKSRLRKNGHDKHAASAHDGLEGLRYVARQYGGSVIPRHMSSGYPVDFKSIAEARQFFWRIQGMTTMYTRDTLPTVPRVYVELL
jgi:hypothetical protein